MGSRLPEPDLNPGVGWGSHAVPTAEIVRAFEPGVLNGRPREVKPMGRRRLSPAILMVMPKPDNDAPPLSYGWEGQFRGSLVFHLTLLFRANPCHDCKTICRHRVTVKEIRRT
jgi:hypothetical protein